MPLEFHVMSDTATWTVDELASRSGLPVRTIREYQTMKVLPPPARLGRTSAYDDRHVARLEAIARLQDRGYSLAGIRDLLDAWETGLDLMDVIDTPALVAGEERPMTATRAEILERATVPTRRFDDLVDAGVVLRQDGALCVPSPSLLDLIAAARGQGVALDDALDAVRAMATGARSIARGIAKALNTVPTTDDETEFLRRGRALVAAATARLVAHQLGLALGPRASAAHTSS
jgi:DNA-binding transcriptional MerR regulator